jgi:hypothetical protein
MKLTPQEMQRRSAASRWAGLSKEERSEMMRRVRQSRAVSSTNDAEEVRRLRSLNLKLVAKIQQARRESSNESRVAEILDAALAQAR